MDSFTLRDGIEYWLSLGAEDTEFVSDDLKYSKKAILHHLLDTRATLIHEALRKGEPLSETMIQTIPCMDLCEVDRVECPTIPKSGCTWLKSALPLPPYIRIFSVTDVLGKKRFDFVKWDKIKYKSESRTPSKAQFYTIRDTGDCSYLYIYGDDFMKKAAVSAIFQEPQCAAAIGCGEEIVEVKCNPLDVKFYMDAHMRDRMFKLAWASILKINQSIIGDIFNNDMSETKNTIPTNTHS